MLGYRRKMRKDKEYIMKVLSGIPVHSTKQFSYNKTDKTFVTEASSLGKTNLFDRLYPDACDVGFWLKSHKTGKQILFFLVDEIKNADDELTGWRFMSFHSLYFLIIFND